MKRLIFTPLVMFLTSFLFITSAADTFIAGFEVGETGYILNDGWYNGYSWEIVTNTETTGINNSDKCMMTTAPAVPDRWGYWVFVKMPQPVTITSENRYIKVMVKRSPNTTAMAICVNGADPWGPNGYFGFSKPSKAGVWGDIVVDLFSNDANKTCENKLVQDFLICLGTWNGTEAGVTMLDNVALSDNPKPRGAAEIAPGLLANFENETMTTANFAGFEVASVEASAVVENNPVATSIVNPSAKALKYHKPANTTWWHPLSCVMNGIIPVTYPNIYLHMMMQIPDATQTTIIVSSPTGKSVTENVYPTDGAEWYDYVVDVSEVGMINKIDFRFNQNGEEVNWENPAGDYFVDDFVLNNSSDPREKIETGLKTTTFDNYKIQIENGVARVVSSDLKSVSVYAVNGQLLKHETATGSGVKITLSMGTYILKIENNLGAISNCKILM